MKTHLHQVVIRQVPNHEHHFLPASCGEAVWVAILPSAQQNSKGTESCPYLVVGLNVSHQDGQVLNAEVHVIVDVLVDALICRPGVSGGRNRRMEIVSPALATPPFPARQCLALSEPRLVWGYDKCGSSRTSSATAERRTTDVTSLLPQAPSPPQALEQCHPHSYCTQHP